MKRVIKMYCFSLIVSCSLSHAAVLNVYHEYGLSTPQKYYRVAFPFVHALLERLWRDHSPVAKYVACFVLHVEAGNIDLSELIKVEYNLVLTGFSSEGIEQAQEKNFD